MAMRTEIEVSGSSAAGKNYLTWAPVRATIKVLQAPSAAPVAVVLTNEAGGGQLAFAARRTVKPGPTLNLVLPANGATVEFFVAGEFGKPSTADGDAVFKATTPGSQ